MAFPLKGVAINVWKKRGAALILTGFAVFLGGILTACDTAAPPESPAPPVSRSVSSPQIEEKLNPVTDEEQTEQPDEGLQEVTEMKMQIQVGDHTFTATLENNAAAEALAEMMKNAPVELQLSDYSGFEKVGPLGTSLPAEDRQTTTQAGDIVLYTGNQIVMFYGSNSWSYTRLGRIDDLTGWEEALGSGDVTVRFSLAS